MRKAVLDTDTLSYVINARDPEVGAISRQYLRVFRRFTVSALSIAEIVEGLEAKRDFRRAEIFLADASNYEILPVGFEEAVLAGRILGALAREGEKIGDLDPFIAAVAVANGLPLVTNNVRHYRRVSRLGFSLELDNWRNETPPPPAEKV